MAGDFEPIIWDLPGRTISVWAVADVHIGSDECDLDGFKRFLGRVMADDSAYIVLCGDLLDNAVSGCPASVYGSRPYEQIETACELLAPLAESGRILGVVSGNHEQRTKRLSDIDPLLVVCSKLNIVHLYRSNMAFVRVNLKERGMQDTYNMLLMHGASAAKKSKFHVEGVDVFISGHTHDPSVSRPARLVFSQKGIVSVKDMLHVTACSWLNFGGYGAAKMYAPKSTSNPQRITLEFTNSNNRQGSASISW